MTKYRIYLLLSILFVLLLPASDVSADTGPKPRMEFTFRQGLVDEPVTIISGILYECDQPDCSDGAPLEELGPQRFTCDSESCGATAYGFAPYHRIEIRFSDGKVRQSNIFETSGFDSSYTVTVRPDDLLVEARFSLGALPPTFLIIGLCILCLGAGGLIAGLIIFLIKRSKKN